MRRRPDRGFTLVSAVFLIVVVALLATFMVSIGTTQQQTATWSVLGARAFAAAQSALERALHGVLDSGCAGVPAAFTFAGGALDGFQATLACSATAVDEAGTAYNVYALEAQASAGVPGSLDFVSRTLTAKVTDAP